MPVIDKVSMDQDFNSFDATEEAYLETLKPQNSRDRAELRRVFALGIACDVATSNASVLATARNIEEYLKGRGTVSPNITPLLLPKA